MEIGDVMIVWKNGIHRRAGACPRRVPQVMNRIRFNGKIQNFATFRRGQAPALRNIHNCGANLQIPLYRKAVTL